MGRGRGDTGVGEWCRWEVTPVRGVIGGGSTSITASETRPSASACRAADASWRRRSTATSQTQSFVAANMSRMSSKPKNGGIEQGQARHTVPGLSGMLETHIGRGGGSGAGDCCGQQRDRQCGYGESLDGRHFRLGVPQDGA